MRPHAIASVNVKEMGSEPEEISQTRMQIANEVSSSSVDASSSLNDLSQRWLSTIEVAARKAEPVGPKNLTRFLVQQKSREVEEHKARILDLSKGIAELNSPLASPRGRLEPSSPGAEPQSKWHQLIQHLSFVQQLPAELQVASPHTQMALRCEIELFAGICAKHVPKLFAAKSSDPFLV